MLTNFGRSEDEAFTDIDPEVVDLAKSIHPLGRLLTAEQCAFAALYLASDMSTNVTGIALPIDGGYPPVDTATTCQLNLRTSTSSPTTG